MVFNYSILNEFINKIDNKNENIYEAIWYELGFIPNREIIFQINLNEIKDIVYNEYTKILFNNNTFIEVKDENIKHILGSE